MSSQDYTRLAEQSFLEGDTLKAIAYLDTILIQETNEEVIQLTKNKVDALYETLINTQMDKLDSLSILTQDLSKNFVTEKTEFDKYVRYIHKRQTVKRSWNRSFIQVHLNEIGELYLSSNYIGKKWLDHTSIRVYDHDLNASTEDVELGSVYNHHSDFLEKHWEKVSYHGDKSNDVIRLIAEHSKNRLKAVFKGKQYYYIILESFDKESVRESYDLSLVLKKRDKVNKKINSLEYQRKQILKK